MAEQEQQPLFTCISCAIAFLSAEEQRVHYRSDHHRYNMKRRVASLPPVSALVFNQKVLDRRQETAIMSSLNGSTCDVCNKTYATENAYRSHINSKKHKETELKGLSTARKPFVESKEESDSSDEEEAAAPLDEVPSYSAPDASSSTIPEETGEEADEADDLTQTIDAKIAAARSRLSTSDCLFCPVSSPSLETNLSHMASTHSFFIPDADYLIDLPGLLIYLGEKIAVGNVCIHCNGKGREFRTLEAVRKHMVDKSHCKIAYEKEDDKLEVSDYYDFTSSYPEALRNKKEKKSKKVDEEWEEVDSEDEEEVDEIVDESASDEESDEDSDEDSDDSDDSLPENQITYGDSHLELVLPSGARIGHRSMKRYYAQSFPGARFGKPEDPNSGAALVRRLLADKNSALVPMKGGFGAFGMGTKTVKARNRGEAREAGRHVREFRDMKRREDHKTKVGFIHNSQKHFRDPLLQ